MSDFNQLLSLHIHNVEDEKSETNKNLTNQSCWYLYLYLRESTTNGFFMDSSHSRGHVCPHLDGLSHLLLLPPLFFQLQARTRDHFVLQSFYHRVDLKEGTVHTALHTAHTPMYTKSSSKQRSCSVTFLDLMLVFTLQNCKLNTSRIWIISLSDRMWGWHLCKLITRLFFTFCKEMLQLLYSFIYSVSVKTTTKHSED